jgi:hypothetical protein
MAGRRLRSCDVVMARGVFQGFDIMMVIPPDRLLECSY